MVLFSRNHNYIATKLLEENENDKFSYGPGFKLKTVEDQDEELFQTARLINNGCYANIIVHDYLRTILGSSAKSDFTLNPLEDAKPPLYGNAVSIEFNVIYRWHGAIGEKDAAWLSNVMNVVMDSMKNSNITPKTDSYERTLINKGSTNPSLFDEILKVFNEKFTKASPEELAKGLPISGSHRNLETGQFPDADILRNLRTGFEQSASELG